MNSTGVDKGTAMWFAFAGKAFLSAEQEELFALAREMQDSELSKDRFAELLGNLMESLQGSAEELKEEYIRLFLDPAGAPCPPWQSVWGDSPQLMGPAHRSALAWYRAAGVGPKSNAEPADHVGLLLTFFSHLLATGQEAEVRRAFVEEHLLWVPEYCDNVGLQTRHAFYRLLAEATRSLVEQVRS